MPNAEVKNCLSGVIILFNLECECTPIGCLNSLKNTINGLNDGLSVMAARRRGSGNSSELIVIILTGWGEQAAPPNRAPFVSSLKSSILTGAAICCSPSVQKSTEESAFAFTSVRTGSRGGTRTDTCTDGVFLERVAEAAWSWPQSG